MSSSPLANFGVPVLPNAFLQSAVLRQAGAWQAYNALALYQSMNLLKQRSPLQPWYAGMSPVTSTALTRPNTLATSSTDSGSDQEADLSSR